MPRHSLARLVQLEWRRRLSERSRRSRIDALQLSPKHVVRGAGEGRPSNFNPAPGPRPLRLRSLGEIPGLTHRGDPTELPGGVQVVSNQTKPRVAIALAILVMVLGLSALSSAETSARSVKTAADATMLATWVWDSKPLLNHDAALNQFLAFARRHHVTDAFIQTHCRRPASGEPGQCNLEDSPRWVHLLIQAHRAGLRVHALDGDPRYALRPNHQRVLEWVAELIRFNGQHPLGAFDGIHLDNEPYLIMGFEGPEREAILRQYLDLNYEVKALLRRLPHPPIFGLDVPFWFDHEWLRYRGGNRNLAQELLALADLVVVMDYRTAVEGANGIVALARRWVMEGGRAGTRVLIGVEATAGRAQQVYFIYGPTEAAWEKPSQAGRDLMMATELDGFPLRQLDDGEGREVGLGLPFGAPVGAPLIEALSQLNRVFGAPALQTLARRARVARTVENDPQYRDFAPFQLSAADGSRLIGFKVTAVMPVAMTFAHSPLADLEQAIDRVSKTFAGQRGFAGMAIHDYEGFRNLPD